MRRLATLPILAVFTVVVPRDAASQQRTAPSAAAPRNAEAIDDTTRAAVLTGRDAIWRAWFANDTAALELEHEGRRNTVTGSASEVFVRSDGVWQNPFWYLGPR